MAIGAFVNIEKSSLTMKTPLGFVVGVRLKILMIGLISKSLFS